MKVKRLRTNNGGEYVDTMFKSFCYEHGIRMERTVSGTPQQNGVAERMNRTLTERAETFVFSQVYRSSSGQKLSTRHVT